ncbi:MAG: putative zinc-binding alcohol dehydrogenase [Stenotrophomonas maltophilia]|nr:MAG: putative zinc-binding alcohol dehydrogenase [Stenotrophomonas maltophilia]
MRATVLFGAGDVRVQHVPDATLQQPTDALVRVVRTCICGSDLWPYKDMPPSEQGRRIGHEAVGVVEAVGAQVQRIRRGDFVIMPFAYSDGSCALCDEHLHTACLHGGFFGTGLQGQPDGAQAEAIRVPLADGTLYPVPQTQDEGLLASLLSLSDVMGTGHHAALCARVRPGARVAVMGDGAVGLCGVIAAKRLGAQQIILMGRHPDRLALGREFGATDVVSARGEEGVELVRQLTQGLGAHAVLECVGSEAAIASAVAMARPGGAIGRVGVPHYAELPETRQTFYRNLTISGGPAPVRAYLDELLPDVLDGHIQPGRVFDRLVGLDATPEGYRAMDRREAIKVMVQP